jgi:DNA-directed RNA polymerase
LGRDQAGAESVNLAPSHIPQDVYSLVAKLVEKLRAEDAAKGVKIAQVLDGFIRRKVIKQTVMTTVYGVTRYGARLQIAKQLKGKLHLLHNILFLFIVKEQGKDCRCSSLF